MEKAKKDLSDFAQKTQTDYQKQLDEAVKNKTANEAQQIKAEYESRLNETVNKRWQELLNPIINDVKKAVSDVAKKNGIDVVLRGDIVITGGIDITDDVIKVIKK
jgi:Skp family chaperone for outer membrane proteins